MSSKKLRFQLVDTPLGSAALVGGVRGLVRVWLPGSSGKRLRRRIEREFPGAAEERRGLAGACRAVERFFTTGRLPKARTALDLAGEPPFRQAVYEALLEVSRGATVTYAELAARIGRPAAHRAVGGAVARNPVPLFVPCHRVVRSDGGLGGFTADGGIELKRKMLALEAL